MSDHLAARVARLERQNRRLSLAVAGLVAFGVAGVAVAMAPPAPTILKAQAFSVVDGSGKEFGRFGTQDGQTFLYVSGEAGRKGGVMIGALPDHSAMIALQGKDGKGGAGLILRQDQSAALEITDRRGNVILALPD